MKLRITLLISLCALLMVSALASAGERMILQAPPTADATKAENICDIFYVCSDWHEIYPVYCQMWHVIYCGPAIESFGAASEDKGIVGRQLRIENPTEVRDVKIARVAPQYHLSSGAVVEPEGEWNPRNAGGELWNEIKPNRKRSYRVANWEDLNHDGLVSEGDRVIFDNGARSRIKAVRFGVQVDVEQSRPRVSTTPKPPQQ